MKVEDKNFITGIRSYFVLLDDINKNIFKIGEFEEFLIGEIEEIVILICEKFARLFTTKVKYYKKNLSLNVDNYKKNLKDLYIKNKIINKIKSPILKEKKVRKIKKIKEDLVSLSINEGIFLLKDYIESISITKAFQEVLLKYGVLIHDMKIIRNKNEHEKHRIQSSNVFMSKGSNKGNSHIDVIFSYNNFDKFSFNMLEFVNIIISINTIFICLQEEFQKLSILYDLDNDPYILSVLTIPLNEYNEKLIKFKEER